MSINTNIDMLTKTIFPNEIDNEIALTLISLKSLYNHSFLFILNVLSDTK